MHEEVYVGLLEVFTQFILIVIGRLFTTLPGVQRQLESSSVMVSHLALSNYIQAGGTCSCINCSPINMSLKSLIYLLEAS